ncbi:MAG: MATE family efflux transporter [Bacteroidetes bacterium]|uniref:Multidrug-efflux transporter n=1 Tax=Candidatus Cryptobacteroides merdigallinarum TaxID=2840770 RepID=A0A9D9EJV8_9BACT|nr:MATE family efflux transporter [Candidatus Cryptobacteroides merdigallinarum]
MTLGQQLKLTVQLSIPAIISQISSILMQFIDASMVGSLGAEASASIGLVSTTTWLFAGISVACATGFYVQVSHLLGSKDTVKARSVLRQSIVMVMIFSLAVSAIGCAVSGPLPRWLGGEADIHRDASMYFLIFMLSLPALQLNMLASGMLRSSGNMYTPSLLNILMCLLDVVFNFFLIFPSRTVEFAGMEIAVPGAGLGVTGAALGTAFASIVVAALLLYSLCFKSPELAIAREKGSFRPTRQCFRNALGIALPMGCERVIMCGAQIMSTVIVAPLGTIAIAANSFAITAESLCYMPGHGVSNAATTLVGQSIGARRKDLTWRFAHISVLMGIAVMTVMGIVMYVAAPLIMEIMTPDAAVRELGAKVLRIEAFAEPMYAASIVVYGVFVGVGDTLVPSIMNLGSIWAVRLTLAAVLAPRYGLEGAWLAMCIELCFRGFIFLVRLYRKKWLK